MARRMTVLLGPFSSQAFGDGLHALLREMAEVTVVPVDDPDDSAVRQTGVDGPAVLIVEGRDPAACRRYLDHPAIRMVVLVDPLAARAFVGVDNPRWDELAEVIRAFGGEAVTQGPWEEEAKIRVIGADGLSATGRSAGGVDSEGLAALTRWLQTCLTLRLLRRAGEAGPGVLGWSVSPGEALDMLALDPPHASEADLVTRLAAAEEDLFGSRLTLPPPLDDMARVFSLSDIDLRLLCLTLAPEIDGRYATAVGVLQDDLTRRRPAATLLAELMSGSGLTAWDIRRLMYGANSLVAKGLIQRADAASLGVDVGYTPSAGLMAHLLAPSAERAAADVGAHLQSSLPASEPPLSTEEIELARQLSPIDRHGQGVRLVGGDRRKQWFARMTASTGLPLLAGDLSSVESGPARATAAGDWVVLSELLGSALLMLGTDSLDGGDRGRVADLVLRRVRGGGLVATDGDLIGRALPRDHLTLRAPTVSAVQRSQWWARAAQSAHLPLEAGGADRLAATVTVEPGDVGPAVAMAARRALAGAPASAVELVQRAARDLVTTTLPAGVRSVEPVYGWDDIVLGEENRRLLHAIPEHVLQGGRVLEDWGFAARVPYGDGVAALFSGPSGTGKTMAAQIIARDLGVNLLQVDLSKTVSKYIGETEKNLDAVFEAAECTGAVLLFDEADAVFGRRTEIKDAHDRHANVEVAYLLQRLEAFSGLTILTTNLKQNIDQAFVRRLRFVVEFALPNAAERARIWHRAFPPGAPLGADVDVVAVAGRLPITGGSIQNIALHAAFLAAPEGGPIGFRHVLAATRRELLKTGMRAAERGLDDLALASVGPTASERQATP
ncbi:ATP-binding protein [Geodermatophilus sp. SYSU D00766]